MGKAVYNWLIVAAALLVGLTAFGVYESAPRPRHEIDWLDVVGEASFLLGALGLALSIHRFELPSDTRRLFFFAAIFFLLAQTQDVVDEFRVVYAFIPGFIENGSKLVGIGVLLSALLNVVARMRRADAERERYRAASRTDALTGLGNRQQLDAVLAELVARAQNVGQALGVIFIDVDDFKRTNDRYGHGFGDEVLKVLAEVLRSTVRGADHAFRLGGEEFVVALPGTPAAGARLVAERIRQRFAAVVLAAGQESWRGTISLGVATLAAHDTPASLVQRADEAMYEAKRAGKNRVRVAPLPGGEAGEER